MKGFQHKKLTAGKVTLQIFFYGLLKLDRVAKKWPY